MTALKAGDKVFIKDFDESGVIATIDSIALSDRYCVTSEHGHATIHRDDISKLHTVRILDNGNAREVNMFGDEPTVIKYHTSNEFATWSNTDQFNIDWNKWQQAESQCREFPWSQHISIPDYYDIIKEHGNDWYAYLDTINGTETFVLVKPKTD